MTFSSTSGRPVTVDDQRITFTDGLTEVDDPFVINRPRYLAGRKVFGIEEVA